MKFKEFTEEYITEEVPEALRMPLERIKILKSIQIGAYKGR
tara:strand:- start:503 stop:625 length:123 start_codon:yes stop_codon:yes gene_type:complete